MAARQWRFDYEHFYRFRHRFVVSGVFGGLQDKNSNRDRVPRQADTRHDTTQVVDSVYRDRWHVELQKGDTIILRDSVFVYKYKYLDKIKETYIHDSIPYTVEVVAEVPRKRSGYDRFCSVFFGIMVVILLIFIAFKICDKIPACKPYTMAIKAFLKLRI